MSTVIDREPVRQSHDHDDGPVILHRYRPIAETGRRARPGDRARCGHIKVDWRNWPGDFRGQTPQRCVVCDDLWRKALWL